MAICADKKAGKLTGRFRVELQKGGKRYRKRWDTMKEAEEAEKAVLAAWERGEEVDGISPIPGAPAVHTIESVMPLAKGSLWRGQASEQSSWAHMDKIAAIIGKTTRLDAVDTHTIDRAIVGLQKRGIADGTINRYLSHLRKFLLWAKKRDYRSLPVEDIEFSWRKEAVGRIRWITEAEEASLKAILPDKYWKLVKVAIETGCRRAELLTIEPGQLNGNRLHLWKTKTNSPRTIPMSQETTQMLHELVVGKEMPSMRSLRRWWDKAKDEMGLDYDEDFVFHATRHTCATRLVDAGINVFVIKEWLGHKRIETNSDMLM